MRRISPLLLILLAAASSAQPPSYATPPEFECSPVVDQPTRYFVDRVNFRWCAPAGVIGPNSGYTRVEWEYQRLDYPGQPWISAGSTTVAEVTIELPQWARVVMRYRLCHFEVCTEKSGTSGIVATGPNVDIDRTGTVTLNDFTQSCSKFIQPVVNRDLVGDEYLPH